MQIGFIGLGRMGALVIKRLLKAGILVVGYNRTGEITNTLNSEFKKESIEGFTPALTIKDLVNNFKEPQIIWMMVKAGKPVDEVIDELITSGVTKGDIIVDGGNSNYKDTQKRHKRLQEKGIGYVDVGTSGGIEGAINGLSLMVGGNKEDYDAIEPICKILAQKNGYGYVGKSGAGHFVKMVHNGVEYAMLEAIGEGFEMLQSSKEYTVDLPLVAKIWSNGSVVRSWLMDLLTRVLNKNPKFNGIDGVIGGGETGRWTVETAKEMNISVTAIETALKEREKSKKQPRFSGKVIAALRQEFGGHEITNK